MTCIDHWAQWRQIKENSMWRWLLANAKEAGKNRTAQLKPVVKCLTDEAESSLHWTSLCLGHPHPEMRTTKPRTSVYGGQLTAWQTASADTDYSVFCCETLVYRYIILLFCMYILHICSYIQQLLLSSNHASSNKMQQMRKQHTCDGSSISVSYKRWGK